MEVPKYFGAFIILCVQILSNNAFCFVNIFSFKCVVHQSRRARKDISLFTYNFPLGVEKVPQNKTGDSSYLTYYYKDACSDSQNVQSIRENTLKMIVFILPHLFRREFVFCKEFVKSNNVNVSFSKECALLLLPTLPATLAI